MTLIFVKRQLGHIVTVECDGHTDFGVEGEDIVCAAISSIVQTAILGLMSVLGIQVDLKRDHENGYLMLRLPDNLSSAIRHDADIILETMLLGISDLHEGYSDFIKLEVK